MAVSKETANRALRTLSRMVESLEDSMHVLLLVNKGAEKTENHARAIKSVTALKALSAVLEDLRIGQRTCLKVLGAVEVPIKNKDKPVHLRLVVDNTKKEGV